MVNEKMVNSSFKKSGSGLNNELDTQMKKIILKMLAIDWIFKPTDHHKGHQNFGDLVKVLAKAPESVLNTDLVKKLVQYFYKDFRYTIMWQVYIPYVVYFLAILRFFSIAVDQDHHSSSTQDKPVVEVITVGLSMILTGYFFCVQLLQMKYRRLDYILDYQQSYIEFFSLVLNSILIYN